MKGKNPILKTNQQGKRSWQMLIICGFFVGFFASGSHAAIKWPACSAFACMFVWYLFPTLGIHLRQRIKTHLTAARQKKKWKTIAHAATTDSSIDVSDEGATLRGTALPVSFLWAEVERLELVWYSTSDGSYICWSRQSI